MNITRTQKIVVGFIIAGIIMVTSFALWYNNTLEQSRKDISNAPSRAITGQNNSNPASTASNKKVSPGSQTPDPLPKPAVTTPSQPTAIKTGSFVTLDPAHYGKGETSIVQKNGEFSLDFSDNFSTNPDGPDLYVWLVKEQKLGSAIGGVNTDPNMYLNLGPLTATSGAQSYKITEQESIDYGYAVVIWCKAFNVQFSNAVLK